MAKHKENKDTRNDFISETAQFFLKPFKLIGKLLEEKAIHNTRNKRTAEKRAKQRAEKTATDAKRESLFW